MIERVPMNCQKCGKETYLMQYDYKGILQTYAVCDCCNIHMLVDSTKFPGYEPRDPGKWDSTFDVKKVYEDEILKDLEKIIKEIDHHGS